MSATAAPPTTLDVLDPATGELLDTIPAGDKETVDRAVTAAQAAFPSWSRTPAGDRSALLKACARRLHGHVDELAELQTREGGKPLGDSRGGVEAGISELEQYAVLGPLHRGSALHGAWAATDLMVPEPRGVVALLVPWNDPIAIACAQIAAALCVGNTVVFKPSEKTPLSSIRLAELLQADLPDGVLQVVVGDARAGRPLAAHPGVDLVMHTGSVATGREIAQVIAAAPGRKALLELGGKDPLVVDAGVDPVWAAGQAALGAFANAGQLCVSVERIYVHEAVAEAFVTALVEEARSRVLGPPLDASTSMGPLIDRRQREVVDGHVQEAMAAGATLATGGHAVGERGCFYAPTVLTGCTDDMRVMREETFGPVAAVQVVPDFPTALEKANLTEYGLAATVLTPDMAHAQEAWRTVRAGTVKVNGCFGGAPGGAGQPRGASGSGFGFGPELLDEMTTTKVVHVEPAPKPLS